MTVHDVRPTTEVTVSLEPGTAGSPEAAAEVATAPTGVGDPTPADVSAGTAPSADAEMAALVRDAAGLLGPRTSALIELSVVQGLADSEVGARLGIRDEIVSATITRTRGRVAEALAIYVLVKTRTKVCPGLRRVVGAHARASLEALMAEDVAAHVDTCTGCAGAWREIPPPFELLRQDQTPRRGPGRDRIWDRARPWIVGNGQTPRVRRISAVGAVSVIALTLAVVAIMGGGAEAYLETAPTGPFLHSVPASPNAESMAPAQSPGATARKQPNPTVPVKPRPPDGAKTKPASAPPTSTPAPPSEPPLVVIISPLEGQVFTSTFGQQSIDLVAVVQDDVDEGLEVDWFEGSTYLGTGNAIRVTSADRCLDSMTYNISATVTDSSGNTSVKTATFTVRCEALGAEPSS